jgi:hypothetical protein
LEGKHHPHEIEPATDYMVLFCAEYITLGKNIYIFRKALGTTERAHAQAVPLMVHFASE